MNLEDKKLYLKEFFLVAYYTTAQIKSPDQGQMECLDDETSVPMDSNGLTVKQLIVINSSSICIGQSIEAK